jgi:hypothetical protein
MFLSPSRICSKYFLSETNGPARKSDQRKHLQRQQLARTAESGEWRGKLIAGGPRAGSKTPSRRETTMPAKIRSAIEKIDFGKRV